MPDRVVGELAYRRRAFRTFNHFTGFDADHDHIVSGHDAVIDAGRFDHKDAALAINGADVAPCERDQVVFLAAPGWLLIPDV